MANKARYEIKIETLGEGYGEWNHYITLQASRFRLDPARELGLRIPEQHFRAYPVEPLVDFEDDSCCLAMFDLKIANVNISWLPDLEVAGFVDEMHAYEAVEVNPHEGGNRYCPPEDEDWKPTLVRVYIKDLVSRG